MESPTLTVSGVKRHVSEGLPGQDRAHSDTHSPDESVWMTDGEQAHCSWLSLASAQTENRAKSETS